VDVWAIAILKECECLQHSAFVLMGASLGGLLAHETAIAAQRHGHEPRLLILVDPVPPSRPLSQPLRGGMKTAARTLIAFTGDEAFLGFPAEATEADYGILLAEHGAKLGRAPFTFTTVLKRQRELRAATHLLDLAHAFTGPDARPKAHRNCRVCLVIVSERDDFFVDKCGLTQEESSVVTARLYGDMIEELEVPGAHMAVCERCITGDVDEFNALLCRSLDHYAVPTLPVGIQKRAQ